MADKNETKIETLYLKNFNTKTSQQSKIQSSTKITKLGTQNPRVRKTQINGADRDGILKKSI